MNLLELAIHSELPLIAVTTKDTLNIREVLEYYSNEKFGQLKDWKDFYDGKYQFCLYSADGKDIEDLYEKLVEEEKCLVLVNTDIESPLVFDAGHVVPPKHLIIQHLNTIVDEDKIERILPAFGGLDLKEVAEICRMAMASSGSITADAVMEVRRALMTKAEGLQQVSTEMAFYQPNYLIEDWLNANSELFLISEEPRLTPRGLLFVGEPGTGKTQGAKHIASAIGVPLYMIDMGGMMGKYVGESEGNLRNALAQVDQLEPCVLLLDEVEKIFQSGDDSAGVTARLLSKLLWWLQEHESRVLTIMTTNDMKVLPKELYRYGRVDEFIEFPPLCQAELNGFMQSLLNSFSDYDIVKSNLSSLSEEITKKASAVTGSLPHAEATKLVVGCIKAAINEQS